MRYINTGRILAAQLTTPADNPLVTDSSRMIDVWFDCSPVRKELFKKMTKAEQDSFISDLQARGFIQSGSMLINPAAVLFAEMEHELVGGVVTIGYQDNGKPVEMKVSGKAFGELVEMLNGAPA